MPKYTVEIGTITTHVIEADDVAEAYYIAECDLVGDDPNTKLLSLSWKEH